MNTQCKRCGKNTSRPKFCGNECKTDWHNANRILPPNVRGTCVVCGKAFGRYVSPARQKCPYVTNDTCSRTCAGKRRRGSKHPNWTGPTKIDRDGYVLSWCPEHPHAVRGYVRKHRLVMEKHLGRHLTRKEVVHHRDDNPSNNRLSNLKLYASNADHKRDDYRNRKIDSNGRILKKREN